MQTDLITIDPQVIQFNRQNTQTIKITNNSTSSLNNFFFCLYNVEKFSFKPQAFSLAPKQHKLVEITLKIKTTKSIAKEFAYLKSTDVNKRLTLLINNFHSPQSRTKQTEEGYSDMNTLSSRDYHELHNKALNKIIHEQQKYMIDETANVRQFNKTQNFSIGSSSKKDFNKFEIFKQIQNKNIILEREIEQINELLTKKDQDMDKIQHQNKFLSDQGAKMLKKVNQKQTRVKQLESLYEKMVSQNEEYSNEVKNLKQKVKELERKQKKNEAIEKQKESEISQLYKDYQCRIKELQKIVESSQQQNKKKLSAEFRRQVGDKQNELNEIRISLENQQKLLKQHQINSIKLQNEKKSIEQAKRKLQLQNQEITQINNNLRQEIFVYKSRMEDNANCKVQQYLQIALQSYKNENENLKKSKLELQKSLEGFINTNRQTQTEKVFFLNRIEALTKQIDKLQQQITHQIKNNDYLKEQHHFQIQQITSKNVLLLEKIAQQNNTKRQIETSRLQNQIDSKNSQIQSLNDKISQINSLHQSQLQSFQKQLEKIPELQEQNKMLQEKVKKYKKQTKKQLKSINDNAFDELKRIHDQKKQLQKKVKKLQKNLWKLQGGYHNQHQNRAINQFKSKSQINEEDQTSERVSSGKQNEFNIRSKSQYEVTAQRKIGIHNQRNQLYDSQSNSSKNVVTIDHINNSSMNNFQIYELREFCAFIYNEQQRFEYIFNLQSELADPLDHNGKPLTNIKPLYKAIKFFKVVENKIKALQEKADESVILTRENNFIRQKMSEMERGNKEENRKDLSAITITNPQKLAAEEDGPSFLINRSNLTNMNVFEMIEFLKGEMKKQYNKQVENVKFLQDKYEILKKKIYRQYRTRIIELVNQNSSKKDKGPNSSIVAKIQNLIERFVQGLSNMTHKEAVLNKEIKIKNNFKQENSRLKQKINQLQHLLSEKHHGTCNRDPVKVFNCSTFLNNPNFKQEEWMQAIKLSAQLLTQKAETERLKEELQIVREDYNQLREEYNQLLLKNQSKDSEMVKLKKNQLELQKEYEKQLQKQNQILEETKHKLTAGNGKKIKSTKYEEKLKDKDRQMQILRSEIDKKNNLLKTYKEKQKKWEEYITQTNKSQEKQKNLASSYRRMEQNNTMFVQNNRELRKQNDQLKELLNRLEKQLDKKKLQIKNLRNEDDENRITKPHRIQESINQIKELEEALKNAKQELSKLRKQKEKEMVKLEGELITAKNQSLIHIRSLESVVRGTIETVRRIFASLKIVIKKKGLSSRLKKGDLVVPEKLVQINATQIYEQFQEILETLDIELKP